jgi:hypothetical protein
MKPAQQRPLQTPFCRVFPRFVVDDAGAVVAVARPQGTERLELPAHAVAQ